MKIDILDEGYWSPEVFRGYQAMASMTERCFGSPGKCWRASWAKGEGANHPTRGLVPTRIQPIKSPEAGGPTRWTPGHLSVVPVNTDNPRNYSGD